MCTVSLRCGGSSLLLTMNRDERHERAPEEAPRRIPGDPGRPSWLAPFDGLSGGTWIGVNDRGVVGCLLNGYEPADEGLGPSSAPPSRGLILPRILEDLRDEPGTVRLPDAVDFSAYPSFTLIVASKNGGELVRWRRDASLEREPIAPGWTFLTSSSWDEPEVARWRRDAFEAWRSAGEPQEHGLPTFHVAVSPGDEARAPMMTRPKSATRSITQIRVDGSRASLSWWPRRVGSSMDLAHPAASLELPLAMTVAGVALGARV